MFYKYLYNLGFFGAVETFFEANIYNSIIEGRKWERRFEERESWIPLWLSSQAKVFDNNGWVSHQ